MTPLPVVLGDNPHVSVSTIESYVFCPRRTYREKFAPKADRLPFRTTPDLIAGSAAHAPVEKAVEARNKLKGFSWPHDWASVTRNADKWFGQEFNARERQSRITWAEGERLATYEGGLHASSALLVAAGPLDIVSVERKFSLPLRPGWTVDGRIDAELGDGSMVDFKTEKASPSPAWKWSQEKADTSLQAAIYAGVRLHETGTLPPSFTFIVARKKAGSIANQFPTYPNHTRVRMALSFASLVSVLIEAGMFPKPKWPCFGCPLSESGGC